MHAMIALATGWQAIPSNTSDSSAEDNATTFIHGGILFLTRLVVETSILAGLTKARLCMDNTDSPKLI